MGKVVKGICDQLGPIRIFFDFWYMKSEGKRGSIPCYFELCERSKCIFLQPFFRSYWRKLSLVRGNEAGIQREATKSRNEKRKGDLDEIIWAHMMQPCLKPTSDFSVTWVNNFPFSFELHSYHLQPKQLQQINSLTHLDFPTLGPIPGPSTQFRFDECIN